MKRRAEGVCGCSCKKCYCTEGACALHSHCAKGRCCLRDPNSEIEVSAMLSKLKGVINLRMKWQER